MESNVAASLLCSKSQFCFKQPLASQIVLRATPRRPQSVRAEPSTSNNGTGNDGDTLPTITPPITPPVEIRFRRSRRRSRQLQQEGGGRLPKPVTPPKDWESMTLAEKAVELYMGEKGLLFWLNKFAYASIFIIIGAWILFRFIGPSLGLYQLDSTPLSPSTMFKTGS